MTIYRRLSARNMSYNNRAFGMHSVMASHKKRFFRHLRQMISIYTNLDENDDIRPYAFYLVRKLFRNIYGIMFVDIPRQPAIAREARTIESFSEADCYRQFRIRKEDLFEVFHLLQFPHWIILQNRSRMTGEEVFLFGIHRFTTSSHLSDFIPVYGRDFTQLNRAFHWFIIFMLRKWRYLLRDMLPFWSRFFSAFSDVIAAKLRDRGVNNQNACRIFAFIDCTVIDTLRPGGGPAGQGENAPRYNDLIQQAFYSGWKKKHGIKFQTVELINGMCMHLFGPKSFRRNDCRLLSLSNINDMVAQVQAELPFNDQRVMWGDGIYPIMSHLLSRVVDVNDHINMSGIRIGNEWNYGSTATLFPFVKNKVNLKIRKCRNIANYYVVATILRNIVCCLYGNVTSSYFEKQNRLCESRWNGVAFLRHYLDAEHRPQND